MIRLLRAILGRSPEIDWNGPGRIIDTMPAPEWMPPPSSDWWRDHRPNEATLAAWRAHALASVSQLDRWDGIPAQHAGPGCPCWVRSGGPSLHGGPDDAA